MTRGLILASCASGGGKTVLTLACLRRLTKAGMRVAAAKTGPDYIDAAFHSAASRRACVNLDTWAMRPATLAGLVRRLGADAELILCEGVMGLFDGAASGGGATADLAAETGWPVVLVVDVSGQGASAAAAVRGFAGHRGDITVAGVIFNRVGSPRHEAILRASMAASLPEIPVLGCVPRIAELSLPARHLGLVQAGEHPRLEGFFDGAARTLAHHIDIAALMDLARPSRLGGEGDVSAPAPVLIPPLGQRIAVARDEAFAFAYGAVLDGWRAAGAEIFFFSPLADEAPERGEGVDAVYLPGGYPELHAGRIAANRRFLAGLREAAGGGAKIFAECGGYMVLGEELTDAEGRRHAMAGLLPLTTSFAERGLHLGYREVRLEAASPLGEAGTSFRGHEFHYAGILTEPADNALFTCRDAGGESLGAAGLRAGTVCGSFIHLIDQV